MSETRLTSGERVGTPDADDPDRLLFGYVCDPPYTAQGDVLVQIDGHPDDGRHASAIDPQKLYRWVAETPGQPGHLVPVVSWEQAAQLDQLTNRFTYHAPTAEQIPTYEQVRAAGHELAVLLVRLCPSSDELQHALDMVDQAVMWGNAAIARNAQS